MKSTFIARLLPVLALVASATFGQQASAQASEDGWTISEMAALDPYTEGTHFYRLDPPQLTNRDDGIVEVLVFFSYGCDLCARVEPALKRWAAEVPDNVRVVRIPLFWSGSSETYATIYWTIMSLSEADAITSGEAEVIHDGVFEAIHVRGERLLSSEEIEAFFAGFDISPSLLNEHWRAPTFSKHRINSQWRSRRVDVTAMVINGKYLTYLRRNVDDEELLNVVDYLVELESAN